MADEKEVVEIKKLVLRLGDADVKLTIAQAKKLHEALGELFGKKVVEIREEHHHYPGWFWNFPVVVNTPAPLNPNKNQFWCSSNGTEFSAKGGELVCNIADAQVIG